MVAPPPRLSGPWDSLIASLSRFSGDFLPLTRFSHRLTAEARGEKSGLREQPKMQKRLNLNLLLGSDRSRPGPEQPR